MKNMPPRPFCEESQARSLGSKLPCWLRSPRTTSFLDSPMEWPIFPWLISWEGPPTSANSLLFQLPEVATWTSRGSLRDSCQQVGAPLCVEGIFGSIHHVPE